MADFSKLTPSEIASLFITSIFCSLTVNFDQKGAFLEITFVDFLVAFVSSFLLNSGLQKELPMYTIPWLFISLWSMCTCQLFSLEEIVAKAHKTYEEFSLIASMVFLACVVSLAFRMLLWGKVFHLTFLKFRQKIEEADRNWQ